MALAKKKRLDSDEHVARAMRSVKLPLFLSSTCSTRPCLSSVRMW